MKRLFLAFAIIVGLATGQGQFGQGGQQFGAGQFPPGVGAQFPQGGAGQFPQAGAGAQFPPQGGAGQFPPPGGAGQFPPQGGAGQFPPPGGAGQFPPQGGAGQFPPQGAGQFPPQGAGQFPPQGGAAQFPGQGQFPGQTPNNQGFNNIGGFGNPFGGVGGFFGGGADAGINGQGQGMGQQFAAGGQFLMNLSQNPNNYRYATCYFNSTSNNIKGRADFRQFLFGDPSVDIRIQVVGLPQSPVDTQRGIHIHDFGDIGENCARVGPHYNPTQTRHGGRNSFPFLRHVGDLGNMLQSTQGVSSTQFRDSVISLAGQNNIVGRTLVIKLERDDEGTGTNSASQMNGMARTPLACCTIGRASASNWASPYSEQDLAALSGGVFIPTAPNTAPTQTNQVNNNNNNGLSFGVNTNTNTNPSGNNFNQPANNGFNQPANTGFNQPTNTRVNQPATNTGFNQPGTNFNQPAAAQPMPQPQPQPQPQPATNGGAGNPFMSFNGGNNGGGSQSGSSFSFLGGGKKK